MKLKIAVLPGDGIGPEVTGSAVRVLKTLAELCGYDFQFKEYPAGGVAIRAPGFPMPSSTLDGCLASDAVLLGAVGAPEFDSLPRDKKPETGLLQLRIGLGGYANLRPAKAYPALQACSPLQPHLVNGADMLVIRELLGGAYFGEPRGWDKELGQAWNTIRYSNAEVERVARYSFELAAKRRGKLTSVDKANVLESSQLWRSVVVRVAKDYPHVQLEHAYVDAFAMYLVMNPGKFDVVVTENMFGDILSDESSAITGSLGMLPSASVGGPVNLYEPIHGSAPDIAGKDLANPLGAIASVAMLLRYTANLHQEADEIEAAIGKVLDQGYRTADIYRSDKETKVSGSQMGALVEQALSDAINRRQAYHAV